jgi:hypothetical protein
MKELKTSIKEASTVTHIELSGEFNEFSSLPRLEKRNLIHIDFGKVNMMNSYGVKTWCIWGSELSPEQNVILTNCPFVFIRHASTLNDFINANMQINSFFVPYYCEKTDEVQDVLFVRDVDFFADGTVTLPQVTSSSGLPMKPDVNTQDFFNFLKK